MVQDLQPAIVRLYEIKSSVCIIISILGEQAQENRELLECRGLFSWQCSLIERGNFSGTKSAPYGMQYLLPTYSLNAGENKGQSYGSCLS